MTKPTIYLAGPITGQTYAGANNWRSFVIDRLIPMGIIGVSPLRCEPIRGEHYALGYGDPRFGTPRAIAAKNLFDVRTSMGTLAYLSRDLNPDWPSIGTLGELCWARALDKPTILVTDDDRLWYHPVVDACAGWKLRTLEEAVEVIIGVFAIYTGVEQ